MTDTLRKFSYSVPTHKIVITLVITIVLTALMANAAIGNHRTLRLFVITLDRQETSWFFWAMAILACLAALLIGYITYNTLTRPPRVELGSAHALLPGASIRGGQIDIPYETIHEVSRRKVTKRDEMLVIKSTQGESRLFSNHFKPASEYEEFIGILKEHLETGE